MGGVDRLPLAAAQQMADELIEMLRPECERIEIAGSIRRQKPDIGDVEIVCIPRMTICETTTPDLFAAPTTVETNALDTICQYLLNAGLFQYRRNANGGKSWGSNLKWGLYKGFAFDIYSATVETWGVTLAIRTGSAEFSHRLVTPRTQRTSNGSPGICPSHFEVKGWRVKHRKSGMLMDTPEEEDVFRMLGIEYLAPELRTDDARVRPLLLRGAA